MDLTYTQITARNARLSKTLDALQRQIKEFDVEIDVQTTRYRALLYRNDELRQSPEYAAFSETYALQGEYLGLQVQYASNCAELSRLDVDFAELSALRALCAEFGITH